MSQWITAQGGEGRAVYNTDLLPNPLHSYTVLAKESGYISYMDAERVGLVCCLLGAGRAAKDDEIDYTAGLEMLKKTGEYIAAGEPVAVLYTSRKVDFASLGEDYLNAITLADTPPTRTPLVYDEIV